MPKSQNIPKQSIAMIHKISKYDLLAVTKISKKGVHYNPMYAKQIQAGSYEENHIFARQGIVFRVQTSII